MGIGASGVRSFCGSTRVLGQAGIADEDLVAVQDQSVDRIPFGAIVPSGGRNEQAFVRRRRRSRVSQAGLAGLVAALGAGAAAASSTLSFVDVTTDSGISAFHKPSFALEQGVTILALLSGGGVVGDFNRDGLQDIFFVSGGQLPDRLYINQGQGQFVDEAEAWGVAVKHMGLAACVGDIDADGWLDIFVTSGGPDGATPSAGKHRLYRNSGLGRFDEIAAAAGVNIASPITCDGLGCAFGDYDLDGDLDLFVAGWLGPSKGNRLFRNNGNRTFTDVTVAAGIPLVGIRGFSPRFADMNGDRYPELLLAADFGTSKYFRNNKNGTFTNIAAESGTGLDANGMGQTVGDFNGDGRFDWYVTSIFSTGNPETPGTGNMLYQALEEEHRYTEVSAAAGVKDGNWGWGTCGVDLDHDGRLDLLATNGWPVYAEFNNKPSRVWMNQGNAANGIPQFVDVAADSGLWHTLQGRGLLTADFDLDGDQDVVIFAYKGPMKLYRNDLVSTNRWLRLSLDKGSAVRVPPEGIGCTVTVSDSDPKGSPGSSIIRQVDGGTNFQSQCELTAHVGVGSWAAVNVRIDWPDGTSTLIRDLETNQNLTILARQRGDINEDGGVDALDLGLLLAAWGLCEPTAQQDLDCNGIVDLHDLFLLLQQWSP